MNRAAPTFLSRCALLVLGLFAIGFAEATPKGISVRVLSSDLDPKSPSPNWAVLNPKNEVAPVQLIPWNLSQPVEQRSNERIFLFDKDALTKALEDRTDLPAPILDLPVPGGTSECLVVVRPVRKGSEPLRWEGKVYDHSVRKYPGGSRLFLNVTPYHLSGACGSSTFEVPPNGSSLVDPQVRDGDQYRADVRVFADLPSRRAKVADSQWSFYPRSRGVILVFEAENAIRLVGIPEEITEKDAGG